MLIVEPQRGQNVREAVSLDFHAVGSTTHLTALTGKCTKAW
jgi:hypothetical protein